MRKKSMNKCIRNTKSNDELSENIGSSKENSGNA